MKKIRWGVVLVAATCAGAWAQGEPGGKGPRGEGRRERGPAGDRPGVGMRRGGPDGRLEGMLFQRLGVDPEAGQAFRREQAAERRHAMEQQRAEMDAFRESIKNMSPEERLSAMKKRQQEGYAKLTAHMEKAHDARMAFLKTELAKSDKLTADQQARLLSFLNEAFAARQAFMAEQFKQRQTALAEFKPGEGRGRPWEENREARKAFMERQREKFRALWSELKLGEMPDPGDRPGPGGKPPRTAKGKPAPAEPAGE